MKSVLFDDWKTVSKDYKIAYYPELYYGNQYEPSGRFLDKYSVEEEVKRHINNIKILLLYFDIVNLPIGHLYVPFNEFSKQFNYAFVGNRDFRELVDNKLIIYSIGKYRDPIDYYEMITGELKKGGFKNSLQLNGDFRNMFEDLLIVERDIIHQNRNMYYEILDFVQCNNLEKREMEQVKKAIEKATLGGNYFMHELFVYNLQEKKYNELHKIINTSYFKISEEGNFNTIAYTPFGKELYGNILRKDINNDVYSFLFSPLFFLEFIKCYIDISLKNLSNINVKIVYKVRSYDLWNKFVDEYHRLLKDISNVIDGKPSNEIVETAIDTLKLFQIRNDRLSIIGLFVLLIKIILEKKSIPADKIIFDNSININLDKKISLQNLKNKNKDMYEFLKLLDKIL